MLPAYQPILAGYEALLAIHIASYASNLHWDIAMHSLLVQLLQLDVNLTVEFYRVGMPIS